MVTIVGQDAAGNHQRVPISPIAGYLRVKCQNHERVPISPISPILVVLDKMKRHGGAKGEVPNP